MWHVKGYGMVLLRMAEDIADNYMYLTNPFKVSDKIWLPVDFVDSKIKIPEKKLWSSYHIVQKQ